MFQSLAVALALIALPGISMPPADPAQEIVERFVAAIQHDPVKARELTSESAAVGFGALIGPTKMSDFIASTSACQLQSISQPPVPPNWNLDGARYFKVVWQCPPTARHGAFLNVDLFVKEKIVWGEGRYLDE